MDNPKEKAKNLVEAYKKYMYPFHPTVAEKQAKECAIIAVDEIIKQEKNHMHHLWVDHWINVKIEIEKL